MQPHVACHPHVYSRASPNRARHATGIITILNEQADFPVPRVRHLLGQQAERNRAGEVEPERDEEPSGEEAAERRVARRRGDHRQREGQAEKPQSAPDREYVPILHATREHHVRKHEREGAHAAERDQVPCDERRRAERARGEYRDVRLPRAQDEKAHHGEPAHGRGDGPPPR